MECLAGCFVAMSFDPSLTKAYEAGLRLGIKDAGADPIRVDEIAHNGKICDRIVVEIRQAQFVVADVTLQRQGVYFEAGYAMGLGGRWSGPVARTISKTRTSIPGSITTSSGRLPKSFGQSLPTGFEQPSRSERVPRPY